jgi:hypothetical protein
MHPCSWVRRFLVSQHSLWLVGGDPGVPKQRPRTALAAEVGGQPPGHAKSRTQPMARTDSPSKGRRCRICFESGGVLRPLPVIRDGLSSAKCAISCDTGAGGAFGTKGRRPEHRKGLRLATGRRNPGAPRRNHMTPGAAQRTWRVRLLFYCLPCVGNRGGRPSGPGYALASRAASSQLGTQGGGRAPGATSPPRNPPPPRRRRRRSRGIRPGCTGRV